MFDKRQQQQENDNDHSSSHSVSSSGIQEMIAGFEQMVCPSLHMTLSHLSEIQHSQIAMLELVKQQNKDVNNIPLLEELDAIVCDPNANIERPQAM